MGTPRKRHSHEAGYIAERMNPYAPGTKVTIYRAKEQALDVAGMKYAIVCDTHGQLVGSTSLPDARVLMKNPGNFCEDCMASEEAKT